LEKSPAIWSYVFSMISLLLSSISPFLISASTLIFYVSMYISIMVLACSIFPNELASRLMLLVTSSSEPFLFMEGRSSQALPTSSSPSFASLLLGSSR
jgi:hypothetical protein